MLTNTAVDLCDGAMDATDQANRATDRADELGTGDAHQNAMDRHADAAELHDQAATERDGAASLAHQQMAKQHRSMSRQHSENANWFFENPTDADDEGGDDFTPAVQNTLRKTARDFAPVRQPARREDRQLVTNSYHQSEALQRIVRELVGTEPNEPSRLVGNCGCSSRREDLLIPPTLDDVVRPVVNQPQQTEFHTAGVVVGRAKDDALPPLTLNFRATPALSVPADDRGKYPANGVKQAEAHSVAWAMADSEPPAVGRDPGGNITSYPFRGTKQPQPSADAAGDRQADEGAPAGRGAGTRGPKGSRGRRAKPSGGYGPDAFDAPPVIDKTDSQPGQFHTAGSDGSIYAEDFFKGGRPLPTEKYTVTQADREAESRRQFGNQPVMNSDEDLLEVPVVDWQEASDSWPVGAEGPPTELIERGNDE